MVEGGGLYRIIIHVVFCIFHAVSHADECCVRFRKIDINFIRLMIMTNNCSFKLNNKYIVLDVMIEYFLSFQIAEFVKHCVISENNLIILS